MSCILKQPHLLKKYLILYSNAVRLSLQVCQLLDGTMSRLLMLIFHSKSRHGGCLEQFVWYIIMRIGFF
jgi:hypothetical protein